MAMKKYYKILLAATVTALAVILVLFTAKTLKEKAMPKEIVSLIVVNKEKLAELVTYRYSRDTVVFEIEDPTPFKAIFAPHPDTVAVYLVRPTICAGIDLKDLKEEDFVVKNDTLFVTLPKPVILDLYLNHADIVPVYDPRKWDMDSRMGELTEKAKADLEKDALRQGILEKAAAKAERSLSDFLEMACQMPVRAKCASTNGETVIWLQNM